MYPKNVPFWAMLNVVPRSKVSACIQRRLLSPARIPHQNASIRHIATSRWSGGFRNLIQNNTQISQVVIVNTLVLQMVRHERRLPAEPPKPQHLSNRKRNLTKRLSPTKKTSISLLSFDLPPKA